MQAADHDVAQVSADKEELVGVARPLVRVRVRVRGRGRRFHTGTRLTLTLTLTLTCTSSMIVW